ncbi:MAG: hypothetical protein KF812_04600 [Fimbriimonadaceae bacterium]|nr:hypothetical protein [Fimbriimonadaceae bacterium]
MWEPAMPIVAKAFFYLFLVPGALAAFFLRERLRKLNHPAAKWIALPLIPLLLFTILRNIPLFAITYVLSIILWSATERSTRRSLPYRSN